MNRIFYSKVGWLYYVLIVFMGACTIYTLWVKEILVGILCALCTWWIIQALTHVRYIITDDDVLVVEMGRPLPAIRIQISSIVSVKPSHNPISSPALSLDRLEICFRTPTSKRRCIYISPLKREELVQVLKKRNLDIATPQG